MTLHARLLNGDEIPPLGQQLLLQASLGVVEAQRVGGILLVSLGLLPMLGHRAAANTRLMVNQLIALGRRQVIQVACGIAGKTVAHREQPHRLQWRERGLVLSRDNAAVADQQQNDEKSCALCLHHLFPV